MLEIKPDQIVQGPRWPEPVNVKLVADLGDRARLLEPTRGAGERTDHPIPRQELSELQIAQMRTDLSAVPRRFFQTVRGVCHWWFWTGD